MIANYQVLLISSRTGEVLALFDSTAFDSLKYSRVINDIGAFALALPGNTPYRTLFGLDDFVEVQRTDPATGQLETEATYLVRYVQRFIENEQEQLVIGGFDLTHLLARRLVDPDDDPAQAGGYSTKAGPTDEVMFGYCYEQIGAGASPARQIPNLTIATPSGTGTASGDRVRHTNLLELLQKLASRGGVDFEMRRTTGNNLLLTLAPIGAIRTRKANYPASGWVGLSPLRGNLSGPSLTIDRKEEKTFVYCLGEGQAERRQLLRLPGETVADSPYNRIEFTADSRQTQKGDPLAILTSARAALFEARPVIEFEYAPSATEAGNVYNLDWRLGDTVTVFWDELEYDLRITEVEIEISQGGESLTVKVAKDE